MKRQSAPATLGILALIGFIAYFGIDLLLFPWSVSLPARRALTGDWYAEVTEPTGGRLLLALDLSGQTGRCSPKCSRLDAEAVVCSRAGSHRYTGFGNPDNWRGSELHFSISPDRPIPPSARTLYLQGAWDGEVIKASVRFGPRPQYQVTTNEDAAASGAQDADRLFATSITLRRGREREFQAACRRLSS